MFEFSFFHQKAKEEPSRFATLLKRARQPSLLRIVKVTQCKQNTAWQKLQKKREEEKEEEKAVPMPKSVPDVEEKGKFGEQQAARAKWFGGMKPAEPAGLPPEKKQRAKSLNGTKVEENKLVAIDDEDEEEKKSGEQDESKPVHRKEEKEESKPVHKKEEKEES
ncbi:hypothetical protein AK812_SmicGene46777 [Symbiodinium microadriaticum]|uniref:Uncharacterized protein n=1 Tax=Symbiodinium microadriaticum TaxID=2951 RepID=A0A1Q9BTB5_SYMMI|nr:hypothetical protein AK812_SmicGene46777 [Symbiodinium microadriaticum]